VGELIILNYVRGPHLEGAVDVTETATGPLEGREGTFFLEEVGTLGIVARRIMPSNPEGLGPPVFVSWGAINSIVLFDDVTEEEEPEEQET
jgi:hypothetical protein